MAALPNVFNDNAHSPTHTVLPLQMCDSHRCRGGRVVPRAYSARWRGHGLVGHMGTTRCAAAGGLMHTMGAALLAYMCALCEHFDAPCSTGMRSACVVEAHAAATQPLCAQPVRSCGRSSCKDMSAHGLHAQAPLPDEKSVRPAPTADAGARTCDFRQRQRDQPCTGNRKQAAVHDGDRAPVAPG